MRSRDRDPGSMEPREDRESVERRVRQTLSEIREAIDQLERTCRQGRITPTELIEERELLRAQEHAFLRLE